MVCQGDYFKDVYHQNNTMGSGEMLRGIDDL
jgi:hypothetical protein